MRGTLCDTAARSGSRNHLHRLDQTVGRRIDGAPDAGGEEMRFPHGFCNQQPPLGHTGSASYFSTGGGGQNVQGDEMAAVFNVF